MTTIKEMYKIGLGPSSSHTMGPEHACYYMLNEYKDADSFVVTLYESLAKTGHGHMTDKAIKLSFGKVPCEIIWNTEEKIVPHPNTMLFVAKKDGKEIGTELIFSVGGGAIARYKKEKNENLPSFADIPTPLTSEIVEEIYNNGNEEVYEEKNWEEVVKYCKKNNITIQEYVYKHEYDIKNFLEKVWEQMRETVKRGLQVEGELPGGLHVKRRAKGLYVNGMRDHDLVKKEHFLLAAFAYAACEENAAGGRMVTAPTCGASGILPAVLYYEKKMFGVEDEEIIDALAVAGIVGNVIKTNASISGAVAGCQAEVGSASSMAAAAVAVLRKFSMEQIECAAEIAMEHCLGLTCDPVKGLVQIPCIERNAVAALRAYDTAVLSEIIYDHRKVSFDTIVNTMYETGVDLSGRYRETAEGGLAKLYKIE